MINSQFLLLAKRINNQLLTSFVLSLSLAVTPPAQAEYKPGSTQVSPSGNTTILGQRGGCENIERLPPAVLAPLKHVGQTVSVRPTFAWFIPDSQPFPIEFKVFELAKDGSVKKLVQKIELQSSPGIMKLSLLENQPGLTVGQRYLWQVAIVCDSNHPSSDLVASAEIQVVEMPPTLKTALSATQNHQERSNLYAEAGVWYDALQEALEPAEGLKLGQVASTLLEELAKLEDPTTSENLRQIASREL